MPEFSFQSPLDPLATLQPALSSAAFSPSTIDSLVDPSNVPVLAAPEYLMPIIPSPSEQHQ